MKKKDWHSDVIYQIYPKSFLDTSGNGYGDIKGIISKLDYFVDLGVTCLWLSPVFESPMMDNGYDISDYYKVDPVFGTNEDMYELIEQANLRGIKIMLDLVVNHTSDQHKWFKEAKKSKENPYRDYYIWRDEKNDLESVFLGDAWEYDSQTDQYYFHLFAKEQPDLNWENEKVRKEIYKMMNFWIDKGVEGFRMDVIEFLGKEPDKHITSDGPNLHKYINEMNRNTFGARNCITVGESWSATDETAKLYVSPERNELSMIFRFDQITTFWDENLGKWKPRDFDLVEFKKIIFARQKPENIKYWNTLFWGNHDLPRAASTYVDADYTEYGAKMLFGISAFMSGTPFIYQGEEIGMTNLPLNLEDYRDIEAINALDKLLHEGYSKEEALKMVNRTSRDNARTPMQWNNKRFSGFSNNKPWIKLNENYQNINVEFQKKQKDSVFNFYKEILKLRKKYLDVVLYSEFSPLYEDDVNILAYEKGNDETRIKVYSNFSNQEIELNEKIDVDSIIISNYDLNANNSNFSFSIQPYQFILVKE